MLSPRKSSLAFALSTATALLFSACGGTHDGSNSSPASPPTSPVTTPDDPSKGGAISLHGVVYGAADTSVQPARASPSR